MTRSQLLAGGVLAVAISAAACATTPPPSLQPSAPIPGAILWTEPADLATRDLFHGPWGAAHAPDPAGIYTLVERQRSGVNLNLTVTDSRGREWSVKTPPPGGLDSEAPVEVVLSRILSAVGYPQPPVYHLPAFWLKDDFGTRATEGGRFRLAHDALEDQGAWAWDENPFIGTRPYQGLMVMLMMFNSTDLKDSHNTIYRHRRGGLVERWFVVRDLGSALGDTARVVPRKNNIDAFEKGPFINAVSNGHVDFAYKGVSRKYVEDRVAVADVEWASQLLGRLSDQQWNDAFRAAGYQPAEAARFIGKLKSKLNEGRSLASAGETRNNRR